MNIANLIALFRIVCLPVIIYLIYQETATASSIAVFLFALAIISDIVDGYVARKRNEVTKAGSFLDLFADKTLTLILMFIFVLTEAFSVWLLLIFVVREIVAIFVRWFATRDSILVGEKVYSKLVVASQFGVVLGLLIENFLIMDNVVDGMF
jgi:CDP-diacylglycerol--glycerol-3-phosphate 3-phosphatidyltransferase